MKKGTILLVLLGICLCLVWLSVYTVSEKDIVIITRFGKPIGQPVIRTGPHRKLPGFIDKINRLDRRIQVFKTRPLQLLLGDQNPIIMTCYVCWQITDPLTFFQSLATNDIAQEKLADMVNSRLGAILGDYSLSQIINVDPEKVKIAEIEKTILQECNQQSRSQYGLRVMDMGIRRITYPTIVTEAVYNRMKAEREKEAKKYRAEGDEKASKIQAATDKRVSEILSEAYKTSEGIKGEGDRESIRIRGEAYSRDPEFYQFLDSLETYRKILGRDTTLILSTDSELFRYLIPSSQSGFQEQTN